VSAAQQGQVSAAPPSSTTSGQPRRRSASAPFWRLRVHEELPSTQDVVLRAAEAGESEGLAVLARRQTAGRGREGRSWASPAGNLHLSVLLRPRGPVRQAAQWALLAAVAVAEAVEPHLPPPDGSAPLTLKWPNDVLLSGVKFAGILAQAATGPRGVLAWLALGIGANLAHAPALPDGRPTMSLAAAVPNTAPPAPEAFAAGVLAALDRWRRVQAREGFAPVRAAWLARGPRLGTPLVVGKAPATPTGTFAGLGEDGSLLLAGADGTVRALLAGEVEAV
jgi:BirA family biotin operon repressor/biotin-[acetyl-CoA-carboxylase] ligase